jgi:uncharacterized membrane protein
MKRYVLAYFLTGAVMLPLDFLWLRYVGQTFYRARLGDLLLEEFNLVAGLLFYALYVAGIVIFAVRPALAGGSGLTALLYGALFGLFAYATYDLSNLATLRDWSLTVTVVDILWGSALTAIAAALGFLLTAKIAG